MTVIDGAVAFVAGAAGGLGAQVVRGLHDRGCARVYAGYHAMLPPDDRSVPIELDVADEQSVARAAADAADATIVVNCAGVLGASGFISPADTSVARWEMEINYFGTLNLIRAFAPVLDRHGGGTIVNVLSIVSFFSYPATASQCASKSAAWSLTNGVRMELRPRGIDVLAVHSSFVDTPMAAGVAADKHDPAVLAHRILDAVEAGDEELLADDRTRQTKDLLPNDINELYPQIEAMWRASTGADR